MSELLDLSARIIDSGVVDEPVNRTTRELSVLTDDVAIVEAFSHSVAVRTDEGLVLFDASGSSAGADVVAALRGWSDAPVHTLVYTHGHLDHVGGSGAVAAAAEARGERTPQVVAHRNVPVRLRRYRDTAGYNALINKRQFGWMSSPGLQASGSPGPQSPMAAFGAGFVPAGVLEPDLLVDDTHTLSVGGLDVELHHAQGETDDHLWSWIPAHRAVATGDLLIWTFPNAGNPQKVQRYPHEWAQALRSIVAKEPELLLPAHGLPIAGRERISAVLTDVAGVLENLVADTVALMNAGAPLDAVLREVTVAESQLAKPYLRPLYDEPEFVVRNVWRLYGGWYDGNPARLKPASDAAVAAKVAALAGGVKALVERAEELAAAGDLRLACQLIEWAAAGGDPEAHRARAAIYRARTAAEHSVMAKGIFGFEAARSAQESDGPHDLRPARPVPSESGPGGDQPSGEHSSG